MINLYKTKMKKVFILVVLITISFCFTNIKTKAITDIVLTKDAQSAILLESSTNTIIYEHNADERRSPASMTKIMTMLLVMEAIDKNVLTLDQQLTTSSEATRLGGTQIYLEVGEKMSVDDLLKSVAVASANDATIVFAEAIGGSLDNFIKMMNNKAKDIGLTNTNFKNPHGLSDTDHYTSARDMALMSAYLINNYPDILKYTSIYEDYVREDTTKKFWLVNRNKLVKFVEGVDGLKTGWTTEAGYCITATIKKDNIRFVSVVMGCSTADYRMSEALAMLNYGVSNYEVINIYKKNDIISTYEDINITPKIYNIVVSKDVNILKKKNDKVGNITKEENIIYKNILINDDVGSLKIYLNNKLIEEVRLEVLEDIKKASYFEILYEVFKEVFLVT